MLASIISTSPDESSTTVSFPFFIGHNCLGDIDLDEAKLVRPFNRVVDSRLSGEAACFTFIEEIKVVARPVRFLTGVGSLKSFFGEGGKSEICETITYATATAD